MPSFRDKLTNREMDLVARYVVQDLHR